jgi:hypothetical protein
MRGKTSRASGRLSGWGWALSGVAVALLGVHLLWALPDAAGVARFMLTLPPRSAKESLQAARARLFGAPYTTAIDLIRRALPLDRPYLLVAGESLEDGGVFWVRYDLAPRPPLLLGRLDDLTDAGGLRRALGAEGGQLPVVVAFAAQPPRLLSTATLLRWVARRAAARPTPAAAAAAPSPLAHGG